MWRQLQKRATTFWENQHNRRIFHGLALGKRATPYSMTRRICSSSDLAHMPHENDSCHKRDYAFLSCTPQMPHTRHDPNLNNWQTRYLSVFIFSEKSLLRNDVITKILIIICKRAIPDTPPWPCKGSKTQYLVGHPNAIESSDT